MPRTGAKAYMTEALLLSTTFHIALSANNHEGIAMCMGTFSSVLHTEAL
jgi:hypothetical protein